ncbi:crustacyanin-A2 subunit [Hyalella azteca]|uniref:Crustacyanin-A2 subunit n=1 Tax=Hyalella azteca TaxID=294128 RepID=A0A8B7ND57_HYAAZ|nr:crustacyanin-A2 subunit [Hyalella azteca]
MTGYILPLLSVVAIVPVAAGFLLPSFLEFGQCFAYPPAADFNMTKFTGTWYTVQWVPNEYIPIVACTNANYTVVDDHVVCNERGLDAQGEKRSRVTKLDLLTDDTSTFSARGEGLRPTAPMNIIATDYDTYACVYSCMKTFAMKAEFAWILSRHPLLDKPSMEACMEAFTEQHEFDLGKLESVEQGKTCPYWSHLGLPEKTLFLYSSVNDISLTEHVGKKSAQWQGRTPGHRGPVSASTLPRCSHLSVLISVISLLCMHR